MSLGWFKPHRIPEGELAPDFTLESTGGEFNLYQKLKGGPILIMFYMGDFGTTCTWSLNKLAEITPALHEMGVKVVGISVNPMSFHNRFHSRMNFPFPLLADTGREATTAYGCLIENHPLYAGMAGRAVYIIDKQGIIVYSWIPDEDPAKSPNFPGLVQKVKDYF